MMAAPPSVMVVYPLVVSASVVAVVSADAVVVPLAVVFVSSAVVVPSSVGVVFTDKAVVLVGSVVALSVSVSLVLAVVLVSVTSTGVSVVDDTGRAVVVVTGTSSANELRRVAEWLFRRRARELSRSGGKSGIYGGPWYPRIGQ
jgi:hypothetical protein